ncbi:MAG: geranylgeranyl reductase family protein [Anaerolineales bacterium]|nr:geranylgeranyl reductase family protein [Anaerolineales bacterium]
MHDVVIVGAGPGGSAAAYYLAKQGLDVLLLDKAEFPRDKTCGDGLTPRALKVLEDMNLLAELQEVGWRINGVELHAAHGSIMKAPIPKENGYLDQLLIVPRLKLDDRIRQRALSAGVSFHSPVRVRGVEQEDGHVCIRGDHNGKPAKYEARLAIMAVGANMGMLSQLGILNYKPKTILAARGYYEGVSGLSDRVQAHFQDVPLPGYAWVFPISETAANIGIGFWKTDLPWRKQPPSARAALKLWIDQNAKIKAMLAGAEPLGPIRGYPLRVDFPTAPTYQGRILLVGEAAGLVSPLTGEGIDFALESSRLAGGYISEMFAAGDFSAARLAGYDKMLRDHFQRVFVFLTYLRRVYINPLLMSRAVKATNKFPELKDTLTNILMGHEDAASMITFSAFRKVVFGF